MIEKLITHQYVLITVISSLENSALDTVQRLVAMESSLSKFIQLCYINLTTAKNIIKVPMIRRNIYTEMNSKSSPILTLRRDED